MPAWNAEDTIVKSMTSIPDQTWQNIELIVVDDCSSDNTYELSRQRSENDSRVRVIRNAVNVGPYVSKNVALTVANGKWVTGHDADDWALPDRLQKHHDEAVRRGYDASLTYMIRLREGGKFCHFSKLNSFSLDGIARKASISCLFKRSVLKDHIGFWDSIRFGADSEMISISEAVLGDRFGVIEQLSMICLSADSSLTNHPDMES